MILRMTLRKKWFDLIKAGVKKEEYREPKAYWIDRLFDSKEGMDGFSCTQRKFEKVIFSIGYPKSTETENVIEFKNPKIEGREGREEWGAIPGKKYIVITWTEK